LPNAVRQLDDQELDQLLAERKRRGKKLSTEISRKPRVEVAAAVPLTQGKLNAVRAAFKAGVTPSRIARQFGISQSDVRKALA
jgi:DNA invertase Pin-like site-specific DNA recombinase